MSKEQWVNYIPANGKNIALADYPISKKIFVDSLRVSSTCPYIAAPKNHPGKARLTEENYYVSPYQPGDSPDKHAEFNTPRRKKMLRFYGWTDEDFNLLPVEYKTNSSGFRDNHFSREPGIACFGCSNTFGTGLNAHQTWPAQLQTAIGEKTWNLGTPGLGLEAATWYALNWLDEDLPNLTGIAVFVPPTGRALKARYFSDTNLYQFSRWKQLLFNNPDSAIGLDSVKDNLDLDIQEDIVESVIATSIISTDIAVKTLKLIAKSKNIPFVSITSDEAVATDWARDLQHRGPGTMRNLAEQFKVKLDKY